MTTTTRRRRRGNRKETPCAKLLVIRHCQLSLSSSSCPYTHCTPSLLLLPLLFMECLAFTCPGDKRLHNNAGIIMTILLLHYHCQDVIALAAGGGASERAKEDPFDGFLNSSRQEKTPSCARKVVMRATATTTTAEGRDNKDKTGRHSFLQSFSFCSNGG